MGISRHDAWVNNRGVHEGRETNVENVSEQDWDCRGDVMPQPGSRKCEEKGRWNDDQKSSSDIDGLVPRILESSTTAEEGITGEIFKVLAEITSRELLLLRVKSIGR